jgi:nitrate reductase alpha subunit
MTWGEQTDVPESADWYNSSYIIAWGSNVPQTRTPDAHFTEVRYKGTKTIAITPDYSEVAKLCDQWLAPKQGTDSALAMAMGHVILKAFHLDNPSDYFLNYCRTYTDMPMLVMLEPRDDGSYTPGRMLRASDLLDGLGKAITRNGKPSPITRRRTGGAERLHRLSLGRKRQMEPRTTGRRQRCRA